MIIQSKRVYIGENFKEAQIEFNDGIITNIFPYGTNTVDVDYGSLRILPGFYDVHTHGYHGYDTTGGDAKGLIEWKKYYPSEGVCGFCPTTLTHAHDTLVKSLKTVKEVYDSNNDGAAILGVHLEGPYINVKYKGAQPEAYIVKPNVDEFKQYQEAAGGLIKIITLAPENDTNFELTKACRKMGVNVSMGHTDATYEICKKAIENGANGFTHTYNAMSPLKHREIGVVGAAFMFKDIFAEIIGDGNHSTVEAVNIFFKQKGMKGIMVTDSLIAKGYKEGTKLSFGGQDVEIYPDGSCHLTDGNKALAGSTLKVNLGLKILVEKARVPFKEAIAAVSTNPASYLGFGEHKGLIKEQYDADLVVLNDDYSVKQTYCKGISQL